MYDGDWASVQQKNSKVFRIISYLIECAVFRILALAFSAVWCKRHVFDYNFYYNTFNAFSKKCSPLSNWYIGMGTVWLKVIQLKIKRTSQQVLWPVNRMFTGSKLEKSMNVLFVLFYSSVLGSWFIVHLKQGNLCLSRPGIRNIRTLSMPSCSASNTAMFHCTLISRWTSKYTYITRISEIGAPREARRARTLAS